MKKIHLHTILFLLLLAACATDELPSTPATVTEAIAKLGGKGFSEQQAIYAGLSPRNKYLLWDQKFQKLLKLQWSNEQRAMLETMYALVRPEFYESDFSDKQYETELEEIWNKSMPLFERRLLYRIFMEHQHVVSENGKALIPISTSIEIDRNSRLSKITPPTDIPACDCKYGGVCYFGVEGYCDQECYTDNDNCGLGWSVCDKVCKYPEPLLP